MNTCQVLNKLKENILDILLPKFCIGCGREGLYICKDCEVFLSEACPEPSRRVDSVWEYEGLMEKLIYKIKFDGCYHIIDELVEKAMAKVKFNLPEDTYITYVPMRPKKERQRGFNQSELIARKLGQLLHQVEQPLLEKTKDNRSQVGLGPKEREENVKGAFRATTQSGTLTDEKFHFKQAPKNVLLVDDIYTTGATVKECVRVLKKAGVKNVWVFTLARKLRL